MAHVVFFLALPKYVQVFEIIRDTFFEIQTLLSCCKRLFEYLKTKQDLT